MKTDLTIRDFNGMLLQLVSCILISSISLSNEPVISDWRHWLASKHPSLAFQSHEPETIMSMSSKTRGRYRVILSRWRDNVPEFWFYNWVYESKLSECIPLCGDSIVTGNNKSPVSTVSATTQSPHTASGSGSGRWSSHHTPVIWSDSGPECGRRRIMVL